MEGNYTDETKRQYDIAISLLSSNIAKEEKYDILYALGEYHRFGI